MDGCYFLIRFPVFLIGLIVVLPLSIAYHVGAFLLSLIYLPFAIVGGFFGAAFSNDTKVIKTAVKDSLEFMQSTFTGWESLETLFGWLAHGSR